MAMTAMTGLGFVASNPLVAGMPIVARGPKHVGYRKDNLAAGSDPTVSDDLTQDYEVGSRWLRVDTGQEWVCWDASVGAAMWEETTGGGGTVDADDVTYLPADTADWDGGVDPGDVADALDQLANRMTAVEAPGWVTYSRIQDVAGNSVVARSPNTSGVVSAVTCSTDGHILTTSTGSLLFRAMAASELPTHKDRHVSGGTDAFASTDLLEAVVKRLRESGSSTDLTLGAWGDGKVLQRSGTSAVGANVVEDLETEVYGLLSGSKLYVYSAAASEPRRIDVLNLMPRGHIDGLTISNNTTDPTNDIDFAEGCAAWVDHDFLPLGGWGAASTKRLDATFTAGSGGGMRDAGSIANGWWYLFLIGDSTNGDTDYLASQSATAPTMPGTFDRKRLIAEIHRTAGVIDQFVQYDDTFLLLSPVEDVASTTLSTSASSHTVTAPPNSVALLNIYAPTTGENLYASSLLINDEALSNTGPSRVTARAADSKISLYEVRVNGSSQIRLRANAANSDGNVTTRGWRSRRGRNAA